MGKTQWNTFLQLSRCLRRCQCHHFLCDLYPVWYLVSPAHRKTLIEFLHSPVGGKSLTIQPENSHVIQFYFLTFPPNSKGIFLSHMNLSGCAWLPFLPTLQRQSTLFLCPQIKYPHILRKVYHVMHSLFKSFFRIVFMSVNSRWTFMLTCPCCENVTLNYQVTKV